MKKRYLLLLLLVACAVQPEITVPEDIPETIPELIVEVPMPKPVKSAANLYPQIDDYVIAKTIHPFIFQVKDAIYDNFAIIPVERYDARYDSDGIVVLVHVFKFSTREELDVVLNSDFYSIINRGAFNYQGHNIALYLSQNDHRVAIWSSGMVMIYVDTFIPDFAAREVVLKYLEKYPSDLVPKKCIDSDGDNHFLKGTTTRIQIGSTIMQWEDVCLRDAAIYRNKQYVPRKGLNEEDGLLEGRCGRDLSQPGQIFEYQCPRGCMNGACKL